MSKIPVIRCLVVCAMVLCCAQAFAQVTIDFDDGAAARGSGFRDGSSRTYRRQSEWLFEGHGCCEFSASAIVFPDLTGGAQ